jgi:hypothetical protein
MLHASVHTVYRECCIKPCSIVAVQHLYTTSVNEACAARTLPKPLPDAICFILSCCFSWIFRLFSSCSALTSPLLRLSATYFPSSVIRNVLNTRPPPLHNQDAWDQPTFGIPERGGLAYRNPMRVMMDGPSHENRFCLWGG